VTNSGSIPSHASVRILIPLLALSLGCSTLTRGLIGEPTATATPPPPTTTALPAPTATAVPPAYIAPQCSPLALATVPAATALAVPTPGHKDNPPLSTSEQLAVIDGLVQAIEDVYLYPDYNGVDWPTLAAVARTKVEGGMETEAFYKEMETLVAALGDEHSQFESPAAVAESDAELAGTTDYVGIGLLILPMFEKARLAVLSVFPGSPAGLGGLLPHDSILRIDGVPSVEGETSHQFLVRGPECSAVVLTIQTPGQEPRDVTFVRVRVTSPIPISSYLVPTSDGKRIGYIFLPTFFDQTIPDQVRQALQDFGPLDGLILDNRMNGGGSSTVVEPLLGYFTSGTIGHYVSRSARRPQEITAEPIHNSQEVPLVVLVAEDTVSFGEIFSGALQDIGRARIVGQMTLGNVETLHGYDQADGSRVWIAEESFEPLVSAANWEKEGILPDVEVIADWDTFTFETDPAVAAAVELLER
jgi:carboxyl-terminal processing protease